MKVLLTGAFGNIGSSTLQELLRQGHEVRCFDLRSRANEKAVRALNGRVEVMWGDLRQKDDVARAVDGQDAVIHLAFILPKLSATGFESEEHPDWAREINVGGTRNLLEAACSQSTVPRFVFASSCDIYGRTNDQPPPRTAEDPVAPIEHYAHHKVECEQLVRASCSPWCILRFAVSPPIALRLDPAMFDVPLDNRMEYIHPRDLALALANCINSDEAWGRILLIGGGPRCQLTYGQITQQVLEGMGVGQLPTEAFSTVPYPTDWLDTADSERLLRYQWLTLDDYVHDMQQLLGARRHLIRAFRPVVRYLLLQQSPYYRPAHSQWLPTLTRATKAWKKPPASARVR